jgi:release factor glutamine methyltransferase
VTGNASSAHEAPAWTIERILRWTADYFAQKGLDSPRLDAEVLLAHALRVGRVHLYTHYDQPLSAAERQAFRAMIKRRAACEPVAYICGRREFYGRDFVVGPAVLIPRPETEHLVEAALGWLAEQGIVAPRIADVGTGSGALAVTLAAELPQAQVVAGDISVAALAVAQVNAERHAVAERVEFIESDLLTDMAGRFDIIVSNPPYVGLNERDSLPADVVNSEPSVALFAGDDGLALIERLGREVRARLATPGLFLCEMGDTHQTVVRRQLERLGPWQRLTVLPDLQGHGRVAWASLGG